MLKDALRIFFSLPLTASLCSSFNSLPVKQLEIRLTVFVGHSENHVLDIYFYDVNIVLIGAGLATCKFGCTFDSRTLVWLLYTCSSIEAGGSAILCDTGVIVWKWPCVLPLVTCSSVMVTSQCWPFLYNYPCYLGNWHCLSLGLTLEVLNAWCAQWWTHFLCLCSCCDLS